jgi:RND family efflux transporter MFP subunit
MDYRTGELQHDPLALPAPDANRRRRRWIIIAGVLAIALAIGGYLYQRKQAADAAGGKPATQQLPTVTVVVPGRHPVDRAISATGTLAAKRDMPVGVAGEGGMVTRVLVEPGQWVQRGQVLATVDRSVQIQTADSLAAAISVARADLTLAQAELQRAQSLVGRGFISQADVQRRIATRDAAAARVKVAQASLGEQRARNGRLDIRAPASGLILTRQVEAGQIVSSGSGVLFRMAENGQLEMRAQLAENDLQQVRVGSRATVTPVGDVRRFDGTVWQVSPIIDQQTRQGVARIQLAYDRALRPGGFASAQIVGGMGDQPQLPQSAILSDDNGNYVFVVDRNNTVQRRNVRLGAVTESDVAIADGLSGNERVVLSAGAFLNPGQKIAPILGKAPVGAAQ